MKLLIIGGTGGTGQQLIKQALKQGHRLTVLARRPEKIKISHPDLTVVKGNVLDMENVRKAVAGQEAVLSALGHKRFFIKTKILSEGTRNIIHAMHENGVSRFICVTSLGVGDSRFKLGLYHTLFVIPVIIFFYFRDKEKQEKLIRASGLEWTIIRPAQLIPQWAASLFHGKTLGNYKHGTQVGNYFFTKMISRAEVAHFMLRQLNNNDYLCEAAGITY